MHIFAHDSRKKVQNSLRISVATSKQIDQSYPGKNTNHLISNNQT